MRTFKGLNDYEVKENRIKYGNNELEAPERVNGLKLFLEKFNDPLIKLLVAASVLSIITGCFNGSAAESIGIIIAIFLATFVSFLSEYKAGKEFDLLNKVNERTPVTVFRNSSAVIVPKNEIVRHDVVLVSQGDEIPADGILLDSLDLIVDESTLNGESSGSKKNHSTADNYEGAYPPNKVYRGTTVKDGEGIFEVTAVGQSTEFGKTSRQASEITGLKTPLELQLGRLGKYIGWAGISVASVIFVVLVARDSILGILTFDPTLANLDILLKFLMIAVALIVMAVPEGLPMSVTLSMALSMRKMTAANTLVRKLHACETMGAATVICTDKTGTLTCNKMKVEYCNIHTGDMLAADIALNSTAYLNCSESGINVVGNPTEGALLEYLRENSIDYEKIREENSVKDRLLFNTERKFMASLVQMQGEKFMLLLKGAPEIILGKCTKLSGDPSGCGTSVSAMEEISKYTSRGMRTLAFARAEISYEDKMLPINDLIDDYSFEYVGFAAMADHMRPGIPESVEKCKRAGIRIIMVTGDMVETAVNIARGAGIWQPEDGADNRISGRDFQRLSEEEAAAAAKKLKVVFRARPADKLKLVKALESDGEIVAVTGDGTNDAPALNYANIGLSMGSGSSVAKQASDIILLDDSFSSVVTAVKWGRSIYRNIQKFLQYQLTINLTALVVALSGPFIGVEFPFTVTQMLWINIIMDTFAALALASEPADENVLYNKPRKTGNFIITGKMLKNITGQGAFFIVILLGMLLWFNRDGIMSVKELSMFFTTFVMLQFWNLFNARTLYSVRSAFYRIKENRSFIIIASIILLLQVLIDAFGGDVFRTEPIGLKNWIIITILTSLVLWGGELGRVIKVKRKTRK